MKPLPYSLFAAPTQFLNALMCVTEQLHKQILTTFCPMTFSAFVGQFAFEGLYTGLQLSQHSGRCGCNSGWAFSGRGFWRCTALPCRQCHVNIFIDLTRRPHFDHQSEYAQIVIREAARPTLLRLGSGRKEVTEFLTPALNRLMAAIKKRLNVGCCVHTLMLAHVRTRALMTFIQDVELLHSGCTIILSDVLLSTMHYSADNTKRIGV